MRYVFLLLLGMRTVIAAEVPPEKSLEFRLVQEEKTADSQEYSFIEQPNKEQREEKLHLDKASLLPASPVQKAAAEPNMQSGSFQISITLTDEAAKIMADVTRKYMKRRIALVVDGKIVFAPTIQTVIAGGQLKVTGIFTEEEALQLATRINATIKKTQP